MNPQAPQDDQQQQLGQPQLGGDPSQQQDPLEHETEDPPDVPRPRRTFEQLDVSERERGRLKLRIESDFLSARSDHDARIARFRRYFRMWRGLNQTKGPRQDGPDMQSPLHTHTAVGQWAKYHQALPAGDGATNGYRKRDGDQSGSSRGTHTRRMSSALSA